MIGFHKNIYLYFLICIFKVNLAYLYSSSDPEFEGWVWRSSLNFELSGVSSSFVDADSIHQEMATITEKLRPDIIGEKNIAVIRLGVVLKDSIGRKSYTVVPCLEDNIFYSGQGSVGTSDKIFKSQTDLTQKINLGGKPLKEFILDEPRNYSTKFEAVNPKLIDRFPKAHQSTSHIGSNKYASQFLEEKLNEARQSTGSDQLECIKKLYGIFQEFEGRQSDSEQKILSFLAGCLDNFPAYWNIRLIPLLRNAISEAEEYYSSIYANQLEKMEKKFIINAFDRLKTTELNNNFSEVISALNKKRESIAPKNQ